MNSIHLTNAVSNSRRVVLALMLSVLSLTLMARSGEVVTTGCATVQKVRQVERNAEAIFRYSQRLYRFYRLTSERPFMQAKAS